MSNGTDKAAFERWVASVRVGGQAPRTVQDDFAELPPQELEPTTIQRLPKDVVQRLRERALQSVSQNDDCTAIFQPSAELLERAKRLDQLSDSPSSPPDDEGDTERPGAPDESPEPATQIRSSIRVKRQVALLARARAIEPSRPTARSRLFGLFLAALVALIYVAVGQLT